MPTKSLTSEFNPIGQYRSVSINTQKVTGSRNVTGGIEGSSSLYPCILGSKTWVNTPGFRQKRASGAKLPDNPFSFSKETKQGGVWRSGYSYSDPGWHYYAAYSGDARYFAGSNDPWGTGFEDLTYVKNRLLQKARGQQWNVPIFLAEGRKTASMVVNRALHLTHLVRTLRRGDLKTFIQGLDPSFSGKYDSSKQRIKNYNRDFGKSPTKAASNAWLEFTYGWTPFMADIHDAMNTLMDMSERPQSLEISVRARSGSKKREQTPTVQSTFIPGMISCMTFSTTDATCERRGVWHLEITPESIPARLGLTNPLTVAWELVPFSFVADWFLPIGDYLEQLDNDVRFKHRGGTYGLKYERLFARNFSSVPGHWTWCSGRSVSHRVDVVRSVMDSAPSVSFKELVLQNGLGGKRTISAIALLRQQLSRLH